MQKINLLNKIKYKFVLLFVAIIIFSVKNIHAQKNKGNEFPTQIEMEPFADNSNHWYYGVEKGYIIYPKANQPRYKPTDLTNIADNIILFQKVNGGWPKNYDVFAILTQEQKDSVAATKNITNTTFDNGTCYTQIEALSITYSNTKIEKYKTAALNGLDYLFEAQYKNGGWPQYYPLEKNYSRNITFNDGAFEGIMQLLLDIKNNKPEFAYLDNNYRKKAAAAFDKAIPCIIKTQINDMGKPTAWCQQYDEVSLQPSWARKFEPPSICNRESADLVIFLMKINNPSKEIIDAINNAVQWFNDSKIYNTKIKTIPAEKMVTPFRVSTTDKIVVTDSTAPPIWTRFYELKTHRPIFCDRDSKIVYSLAEVTRERRDGYGWYTYAPKKVLELYPAWQKKWAPNKNNVKETKE